MPEQRDIAIWECSEQITEQVISQTGRQFLASRGALICAIYNALLPLAPELRQGKTAHLDLGFAELEVSLNAYRN